MKFREEMRWLQKEIDHLKGELETSRRRRADTGGLQGDKGDNRGSTGRRGPGVRGGGCKVVGWLMLWGEA